MRPVLQCTMDITYFVPFGLGIFVGLIMGLTGAGGGIIAVPLLVFGLNLNMTEASPISLVAVSIVATVGAFLAWRKKILRYKAASLMGLSGLIMAPFGIWLSHQVPNTPLLALFSLILFYVSFKLFIESRSELKGNPIPVRKPPPCILDPQVGKLIWTIPCARALISSGALAGFLTGLLGVGGGFIIVPALKRFTDLPMKSIIATSLGMQAIISGGSVIVSGFTGHLNLEIALLFVAGALLGLYIGKAFGQKVTGARAQQSFSIFAFCVAIRMVIKIIWLN